MTKNSKYWMTFIFGLALSSQIAKAQTCNSLADLAIFEGSWQEEKPGQKTIENWKIVSKNSIEGTGAVYNGSGHKISFESLRIVRMSDEVFYIAKVAQNDFPTSFKLIKCGHNKFEFENSNHDFPKRITYLSNTPEQLFVTVSGKDGEGFDINFQLNSEAN